MAKKKTAKGLPSVKVIGGKRFSKKGCSSTKKAANLTAEKARKGGKNARVMKDPVTKKYCVYTAKKG